MVDYLQFNSFQIKSDLCSNSFNENQKGEPDLNVFWFLFVEGSNLWKVPLEMGEMLGSYIRYKFCAPSHNALESSFVVGMMGRLGVALVLLSAP